MSDAAFVKPTSVGMLPLHDLPEILAREILTRLKRAGFRDDAFSNYGTINSLDVN